MISLTALSTALPHPHTDRQTERYTGKVPHRKFSRGSAGLLRGHRSDWCWGMSIASPITTHGGDPL